MLRAELSNTHKKCNGKVDETSNANKVFFLHPFKFLKLGSPMSRYFPSACAASISFRAGALIDCIV